MRDSDAGFYTHYSTFPHLVLDFSLLLLFPQAEELIDMASDTRRAVLEGRVYAIQTRSLTGETETLRCGKITLSQGYLHVHCLVNGPPPQGSITIEVSGSGLLIHRSKTRYSVGLTSITDVGSEALMRGVKTSINSPHRLGKELTQPLPAPFTRESGAGRKQSNLTSPPHLTHTPPSLTAQGRPQPPHQPGLYIGLP